MYINGGCLQFTNIYILCKAVATHNGTHQGACLAPDSAAGEAAGSLTTPGVSLQGGGRRGGRLPVRSGAGS